MAGTCAFMRLVTACLRFGVLSEAAAMLGCHEARASAPLCFSVFGCGRRCLCRSMSRSGLRRYTPHEQLDDAFAMPRTMPAPRHCTTCTLTARRLASSLTASSARMSGMAVGSNGASITLSDVRLRGAKRASTARHSMSLYDPGCVKTQTIETRRE